jgi:hypothetical protein
MDYALTRELNAFVRVPYRAVQAETHVFFIAVLLCLGLPVYPQGATDSKTDGEARWSAALDLINLFAGLHRSEGNPA